MLEFVKGERMMTGKVMALRPSLIKVYGLRVAKGKGAK